MFEQLHFLSTRFRHVYWLAVLLVSVLAGCGGGGGDGPSVPVHVPGIVSGQVVKGLTSGSTVSLYRVAPDGQRSFIASAETDALGAFSLNQVLQVGSVYLIEAVGGHYRHEVTGAIETLDTPMRGVFVATGSEAHFSVSAFSEILAREIERVPGAQAWRADAVAAKAAQVATALDMPSLMGLRYVDLASLGATGGSQYSEEEIAFSFQAGSFAGFFHEMRLRDASATLDQALRQYRALTLDTLADNTLPSIWFAGVMRYVEKVPALVNSGLFAYVGIYSSFRADAFDGAETSGQAPVPIPNQRLRHVTMPHYAASPTSDTFFDARGAMIASRLGDVNSGLGFTHYGFSSVADVYGDGDAETAIGRWNRGYFYRVGVTYDAASGEFITDRASLEPLAGDLVYAAAIPATEAPACGTVVMALQSQTKAQSNADITRSLSLDPSSRLAFFHSNGAAFVGYDLTLRDGQGHVYTFSSPGGASAPWQGSQLDSTGDFAGSQLLTPFGTDRLEFNGLVAGRGAKKAVLSISSNLFGPGQYGLAVAFAQTGMTQACAPVAFDAGLVNPLPVTGDYYVMAASFANPMMSLSFFANGTPNFLILGGITAASGVEKMGNDLAGIGIMNPPFQFQWDAVAVPDPYFYVYQPSNAVYPASGTIQYQLLGSTPVVVKRGNELVAIEPRASSATLTIHLNQFPLGTVSAFYGTCELTIPGASVQPALQRWTDGVCNAGAGVGSAFSGGVAPGDNYRFAALKITETRAGATAAAAMLFERIP